jgi:hypothetical protein
MMFKEFDRQVNNLIQKGYPEAAGLTEESFLKYVEPLKKKTGGLSAPENDLEKGNLPFVIVIKSVLIPIEKMMALIEREGEAGIISMSPVEPSSFKSIEEVNIPKSGAYLIIDIDRGKETLNVRPNDALKIIRKINRSPLTIEEGIAILIHHPDFLMKNNCFSLLASRRGDKRVPALWLSGAKPKLGWCWAGNPHTWLGSASCASRAGL